MTDIEAPILVAGATGNQGGAVARALLAQGRAVRALVRNPDAPAALALRRAGCELKVGSFEDTPALVAALDGAAGAFSVQRPDADNSNSERRHGAALVEAARQAGVAQFVHSSVCQVDDHAQFPRWDEGYWSRSYWTDKAAVEDMVRGAGFASITILRPSFIMENFTRAKSRFLYPQLTDGLLLTPIAPDSAVQLIASDDIGAFAAAAFADPAQFGNETIELAGDSLRTGEIAAILGDVLDRPVEARSVTPDEALAAGLPAAWVRSQEWINDVGYQIDQSQLARYRVPLTSFRTWASEHRDVIRPEARS